MTPDFNLDGKTALVTGASGGLGRHFAGVLAAAGARVVVCARRMDKVLETVAGIEALSGSGGGKAIGVEMDVTDAASVAAAFEAVEEQAGTVTVVVNNAGVADGKAALELTEDDWDRILDTNLKGAWTVAQKAAKRMAAAETGGVIVNIASVLGLRVGKGVLPYAVSKAGLVQMTKALALELAPLNIRVNALAPGYVGTDLTREYLASEHGQKQIKRVPFRRPGTMEELSGPLLLLCSDASAYMTGSVLAVDGGHLVSSL
ncbi:MAG: 2-deoxy-D-gluconate 3-dehydrogenase [Rhodospirillaceae bacterium]|jgi:NAD(P)-dependent dehydrogenase (short-subunit alcohol dehydrogenase family)|nr:2-deoxy-D-gluconate 3-dehydrogenase [Rhodospirillaceae bacterium]|tara:strand:- start:1944 stop:2723 length:780 start_codon:yes stop_codon:yes gene_type:complete